MAPRKRKTTIQEREWYQAQRSVRAWLGGYGISSEPTHYNAPYDLLTSNGLRIEVKASGYEREMRRWSFNIHRHGVLDEGEVDFYILRCESGFATEFLGTSAFHLVVPAPLGMPTLRISIRNLLCGFWSGTFNNIECLLSYVPGNQTGGRYACRNDNL